MSIVSDLRDIYGNNITATEVKKYARDRGISYPTVTRKLEQYKVKRGTWNLTIAEELEKAPVSCSNPCCTTKPCSFCRSQLHSLR